MSKELVDNLAKTTFNTTAEADKTCANLTRTLGLPHRYVAARLAIARSLSISEAPPAIEEKEARATPMRGVQLFGEGGEEYAWLSLIRQHSGIKSMSKQDFQGLVASHWKRGAGLLERDWIHSGQRMADFISHLVRLAQFAKEPSVGATAVKEAFRMPIGQEVYLPVGEVAQDVRTGNTVGFSINGAGGSPHVAIMGGVGSGKTRTAVHMLRSLRQAAGIPLLAFDFKGDLADSLSEAYSAQVLRPPEEPVPLDILHAPSGAERDIVRTADCVRDSIGSVKESKISGIQKGALWNAVETTLQAHVRGRPMTLKDVAEALSSEYEEQGRRHPDELTVTLNELTRSELFCPETKPSEFFANSWIIQMPQDSSDEMRRLIINLTLNALDRWLLTLDDAPTDDKGVRTLRHVTLLDEAHVVLKVKLPALGNLIRMSRSKGGAMMLVSQSPDDFEGTKDDFLDHMGMTLAFVTQAKPGATKRIFDGRHNLSALGVGESLCRIRTEAKTRKVVAWKI